jgi:hypothetical protein
VTNENFASGAFCFCRARGIEPHSPGDLQPIAARHGIDPTFIPSYAGDRTAVGRALAQATSGLAKEGWLLRPITRTTSAVVYGIVKESRCEAEQKLEHDFEATVAWAAEPNPSIVAGDHSIARRVADAYRDLRGKIVADDWSASITAYLESHDAARVRGDGRVYWVPPQRLADVKKLGAFLQDVGIDLILCELEPEVRSVVESVAQESLDEQIAQLEAEAQEFDGTQKPSTYERRLDEYQHLRERAVLYRDALGIGVDRAQCVLTSLEKKVADMLEIRRHVVVHRNGTVEKSALEQQHSSERPIALKFAGAKFTAATSKENSVLLFVSDDAGAKSAAQALEAMGLAGKWQQAGTCQVSIKNSGPVGAAVSIRVRLGEQPLKSAAKALAGIGIELFA